MTPGARISAAISLLDDALAGEPAERALTRWARASRFAGSKDRAAVRDHVYDALRQLRSLGWRGGGAAGRQVLIGQTLRDGLDFAALFTGEGHDPAPLSEAERAALRPGLDGAPDPVRLDYPDHLDAPLRASLGDEFEATLAALRERAPVDLRVNRLKSTAGAATVALARDGVHVEPHPLARDALRVAENPRLVAASRAYSQGMVELQDVASQYVCEAAGAAPGMTVLDYCAGGGGKTLGLATAMQGVGRLMAWDISARRMADLPQRAARAGATVEILDEAGVAALDGRCDLVLVDAPCSGSGAWRRKPEGKWALTARKLAQFPKLQDEVLDAAAAKVAPGGLMVYATCSLFRAENEDRAAAFAGRHGDWIGLDARRLSPLDGGDGFYMARFRRPGRRGRAPA